MKNSEDGFTLVEILVAISITAFLIAIIFPIFSAASKVNANAKEIDNSNALATSISEKIKNNPTEFMTKAKKNKKNDKVKSNITIGTTERYYDYDWREIHDANKAEYTVLSKVTETVQAGKVTAYRPKINKTNSSDGEFTDKITRDSDKYLIIAVDVPSGTVDHNYETYLLKEFDEDKLEYYMYHEFKEKFNERHKKECNGYDYVLNRPCDDHDNVFDSRLVTYGHDTVRFYALRQLGCGNYDTIPEKESGVQGVIPMYINVEESTQFNKYNVEIVNTTKKDLDIYISEDGLKNHLNFKNKQGVANVTHISEKGKSIYSYDINVVVTRNIDKSVIANYNTNKYIPNKED